METCTQVIAILASRPTFYPVRGKSCFRRSVRLSTGARRRPELRRCLDPAPLSDMPLGSPVIPLELCPAGLCVRKRAVALLSSASSNPELKGEHHTETIRIAIQFGPSEHVNIAFLYITAFNRYVQSKSTVTPQRLHSDSTVTPQRLHSDSTETPQSRPISTSQRA